MSDKKQEARGWFIAHFACLIIGLVFIGYALIFKQPCDGISNEYLSCRITGTVGDWVGSLMFLSGLVVMSGILKGFRNLYNSPNSTALNYVFGAFLAIGLVILWNL